MDTCVQCGASVPVGSRFCSSCGAPLAVAAEVRKTVTVLFCDVVGSTELGERLDPEVLRDTMARFYAVAREPVERHGGTVQKVIGDALVAVFGVPVVHEDDALRAVRAALEMRDAVRAMGELDARIGVNTGEVLAGDASLAESLVVGDAVNIAARLEQAAPPGEVFVGEATWALVAHAVDGERCGGGAGEGQVGAARRVAAGGGRHRSGRTASPARSADGRPRVGARPAALGRRANGRGEQAAPGHHARAGGHREVPARLRAAPPP